MNPLGVSVAFVICSIMLSFLKNSIFEDSQATSSVLKINKIFQLSNNEVVTQNRHYKSLYEAYYKYEMPDASKAANNYWNRSRFNQSVLGSELGNGQKSFLCGIDYLLVINSGIQLDPLTNPSFQNTLTLYKLPFLTPISEQKLQGKLNFPQKCKKINYDESMQQEQQKNYEIILNSKDTFIRLIINQIGIHIKTFDKYKDKSRDARTDGHGGIVCYDFVGEIVGGWVGDRPWVVVVWDFYGNRVYQINILAENSQHVSNKAHRIQVTQILLQNPNKQTILTIVYKHQHTQAATQNITLLVYKLNNNNNSTPQLVHRSIIDTDYPKYHYPNPTCQTYWNSIQSSFDLSCIIHKNRRKLYKFVNFPDLDRRKQGDEEEGQEEEWVQGKGMANREEGEREVEAEEEGWISYVLGEDQGEKYSGEQEGDEQVDSEVEISSSQNKKKKRVQLTFKNPQQSQKHLIKPSKPPLLYYQQNKKHFILMFTMPEQSSLSAQELKLQYLLYELIPPAASASSSGSNGNGNGKQENEIKSIKLIQEQNCFLVVWTNSLEIYSFDVVSLHLEDIQGVDVIVILPFLELFATVYCILRTIWTND